MQRAGRNILWRVWCLNQRASYQVRHVLALSILASVGLWLYPGGVWAAENAGQHATLITSIGLSILAATVMAFLSHMLKQPLLLAYIAAGILIGPQIGLGLVTSESDIRIISEIGLILLLFMIGLEIDVKKLRDAGASLLLPGIAQFLLCTAFGLGFFLWLGYGLGAGTYDALYLACCCALSSTTIVVKLLYGKFELDTLAGRLTLGILIFQDIWAIVILGLQPNLAHPDVVGILVSFAKGALLLAVSLGLSRYALPRLFHAVAKLPEIVLVASLGWCFAVAGMATALGLSPEMGALIAGVAISTFPYNLDVIAKIIGIRDFFITLFFVALGMEVPNPLAHLPVLAMAGVATGFLVVSRLLSVFPCLYGLRNGHRVSLLSSINLSQMSEFSLVIAAIGMTLGHISHTTLSLIIFIFVLTSIGSTYMIQYSDPLQKALATGLRRLGLRDVGMSPTVQATEHVREIVILGFYRVASSFLHELLTQDTEAGLVHGGRTERIVVIDFNPDVHRKLQTYGIPVIYGDISHLDTLHHAGIHHAKLVLSTIPDPILVGTDNLRLIKYIQRLCPHAKILVTAENTQSALQMYAAGADYVLLPRVLAAQHVCEIAACLLQDDGAEMARRKQEHITHLRLREEIVS